MDCPPTLQQSISLDTETWRTVFLLTGCVYVKNKHKEVNTKLKKQRMCLKPQLALYSPLDIRHVVE